MRFHECRPAIPLACAILMLLCAGCMAPSLPTGASKTSPAPTQVRETGDAAFISLYESSHADIAARLERMNRYFPVGAATRNVPYLPSELRSSALELKNAAEAYHASMIRIEPFAEKENEIRRNAYLKYLSTIRKVSGNTADAAGAEMDRQYALAQNYAESARDALKNTEGVPGFAHENLLKTTGVSLDDYIQKMREKRV